MTLTRYFKSHACMYISKTFLTWFMITSTTLLVVIGFFESLETLRRVLSRPNASFGVVIELTLLILPQRLNELLPFIIFLSSLLGLWRMNQQQEITAARSLGISGGQIASGMFALAILIGTFNVVVLNPITAIMNAKHAHVESKVLRRSSHNLTITSTGFWLKEIEGGIKTILHAESFYLADRILKNVTFYEFDQNEQFKNRIDAEEAILQEGKWHLKNVQLWSDGKVILQQKEQFRPTHLTIHKIQDSTTKPSQIPFWKIPSAIDQQKKNGMSTLVYDVYWHKIWADIFMLGVMAVLAVGFCLHHTRYKNASIMIGNALIVGFVIHFFNNIIHAYGIGDRLSPLFAAWIPPLVTGLFGVGFLMHMEEST